MKKIVSLLIILLFVVAGCKTIQYVPIETDTKIEYRDTTIYKDSIVYIPKETIKEVVPMLDTLSMESSMATAIAWLDTTTTTLKGRLENKKGIEYKYIYKDKIVVKDSIITKEIPVEVEVEKIKYRHTFWDKLAWLISGLSISILVIYIVHKLYGTKGKLL